MQVDDHQAWADRIHQPDAECGRLMLLHHAIVHEVQNSWDHLTADERYKRYNRHRLVTVVLPFLP